MRRYGTKNRWFFEDFFLSQLLIHECLILQLVDSTLNEDAMAQQNAIQREREERARTKLLSELRHTFSNPKIPRHDDLMYVAA